MELKFVDRLLVAALGLSLLGAGVGLLLIRTAPVRAVSPSVDLRWAGENYREILDETAEIGKAGVYTEVSFDHK